MPASFLTIIIPALNESGQIREQLESLQPLRQQGVLLVLVDGGSEDGTPELARPLVDQLIHSARGRATQMNAGAHVSTSDVLLFLHADTLLPPNALECIRHARSSGAPWGHFDVRIDSSHPALRIVERLMNWRSRWTGIATGDQGIFVSKSTFELAGGYPQLPLMEDIALSSRLKRIAPPVCLKATVLTSGRRWEKHGILRTIALMWRLRAEFYFGADPEKLARRYGYLPPRI
ncbi:MAG: TIGR04283 family arsenosugar biosynthesis glycosyltransferase [Betaproteobacteria bacterium]